MRNFFILHGTEGSPYGNWFQWLYDKIEYKGYKCYCPHMPTPENQNYTNWESIMQSYVKQGLVTEETTFVCHSSACVFIVKFCIKNNIKIGKLISVAGFNNCSVGKKDYDKLNSSFFVSNPSAFIELCRERICLYSDNDKYIKLSELKSFAESIRGEHVLLKNCGHLNKESGFTKLSAIELYLNLPRYDEQSY